MKKSFDITLIKGFMVETNFLLFEIYEQCTFLSENCAVNLYPHRIVARALEEKGAIIVLNSMSCALDSHYFT